MLKLAAILDRIASVILVFLDMLWQREKREREQELKKAEQEVANANKSIDDANKGKTARQILDDALNDSTLDNSGSGGGPPKGP